MTREAIDEIVLAPMRLIGDHDDIAPFRQHRVAVAFLLRHEFLDRREYHAARGSPQLFAQIRAAFRLLRVAAQQIATAREGVNN